MTTALIDYPKATIVVGNTCRQLGGRKPPSKRRRTTKSMTVLKTRYQWCIFLDILEQNSRDLISQVQFKSKLFKQGVVTSHCYQRHQSEDGKTTVWRFQTPPQVTTATAGEDDNHSIEVRYTGRGGTVRSIIHNLSFQNGNTQQAPALFTEPRPLLPLKYVKMPELAEFGVELELSCDKDILLKDISGLLQKHTGVHVHHCTPHEHSRDLLDGWRVVSDDGTVLCKRHAPNCSRLELVSSSMLRGGTGLNEINNMLNALQLLPSPVTVNKSMGFHVHVCVKTLSVHELVNVCQNFVKYEEIMDTFMPHSRRTGSAENGRFFKSNKSAIMSRVNNVKEVSSKKIDACKTKHELCELLNPDNDCHYKLNLLNLKSGRQPTLEFRQHEAAIQYADIAAWIRFCVAFVHNSATLERKLDHHDDGDEATFDDLFEHVVQDRALRDYFAKQVVELRNERAGRLCTACGHGMECE